MVYLFSGVVIAVSYAWSAGRRVNATDFVWRVLTSKTYTQRPMHFTSWGTKQPDSERDTCVVLYHIENFDWHDVLCTHALGAVCEIDMA